jgi:hypothetical protein
MRFADEGVSTMRKTLILTALAATAALAALPARAGDVYWSVGISAPIGYSGSVGTVVGNAPVYAPAPVYVAPAPVYYAPPPVYYAPPPSVYYAPAPVYVRPAPVVYGAPVWAPAPYRHHHRRGYDYRRDHYYGPIS